jgi:hypothetical protein
MRSKQTKTITWDRLNGALMAAGFGPKFITKVLSVHGQVTADWATVNRSLAQANFSASQICRVYMSL